MTFAPKQCSPTCHFGVVQDATSMHIGVLILLRADGVAAAAHRAGVGPPRAGRDGDAGHVHADARAHAVAVQDAQGRRRGR